MKRGDVVTMAVSGDYGKPRPALIIQANTFAALPSVTVLRLSTDIKRADLVRITVQPTPENGLKSMSQVMIDKAVTVPRENVGKVLGRVDEATLRAVSQALVAFFDLEGALV